MSKSSIALIGFMGAGKSAVGKALAARLGKRFIELDSEIERQAGKSIRDIFARDGEIAFRELEIAATRQLAGERDAVIACGGGIVLNRINIDRLRRNAVIIYLTATPSTIVRRTANDGGTRPLLSTPDRLARVRELLRFRQPFYERAADITINTTRLDITTVVAQIIDRLNTNESFNIEK